jgi:hypothetical protein
MKKIFIPISIFAFIFGLSFAAIPKAEAGACLNIPGVTPYGQCANNPAYDYAGPDGTLINPNGSRGGGWYGSSYGNGYGNIYSSNYGYGDGSDRVYGTWYGYSFANQNGYGYNYDYRRQDRQVYPQYPTGACFKGVTFNYSCPQ